MIHVGSIVSIADTSGAVEGICIKILGSSSIKAASIGDVIVVSIRECLPESKVGLGSLHRALVVRTRFPFKRGVGVYYRFNENAVVLVNKRMAPKAKRIKGPILKEICLAYDFIGSLAPNMV